ncbi:hypothetical protein CA13_56020 [Planctomycetes bacterium CA13]|uniref:3-keto-disaccharide hydrolase domain-containing protein n=1 Tax=Novipirellula herctigrandis TaxID=2527986 RepID=A0A5C5ZAJ1_9BACT|nr:hypothetical protein CA13_56020 [Planctomycetes bacterium CA13]
MTTNKTVLNKPSLQRTSHFDRLWVKAAFGFAVVVGFGCVCNQQCSAQTPSAETSSPTSQTESDVATVPVEQTVIESDPQSKNAQHSTKQALKKHAKNATPLKDAWVVCQFGGDGEVELKGNSVTMGSGDPLTGIRWEGALIRENYEISLEARRVEGYDFFCALTFPVGKDSVSLVLGGWGGGVVGISNIDGSDAAENPSTQYISFDNGKWYKIRTHVTEQAISYWIDGKLMFEQPREGHEFGIRSEMYLCEPLGLAAYMCDSEIRNIQIRKLDEKMAKPPVSETNSEINGPEKDGATQ